VSLNAQRPGMPRNNPQRPNLERVKAVRVAVLTEKMNLSAEEAEKFWPVYNEYEKEQKKIREKFQPNKDILALDDSAVEKHLFGMLDMEEELVKLKKKYYLNFSKMVGYRKVAILAKSDREFNFAMIERLKNQSKKGK
jgi:hypothetical protein